MKIETDPSIREYNRKLRNIDYYLRIGLQEIKEDTELKVCILQIMDILEDLVYTVNRIDNEMDGINE